MRKSCNLIANIIVNTMVVHEEGGSCAHAKFTRLPCFTLLRRNSGDNSFHKKETMNSPCSSSISERILSFADMWDVDHPVLPRSYCRPNLSHCKLFGRRNHHEFVEFRFFKKTYCTRNTATTREDWTTLYHVISLKPIRPN